MGRFVYSLRPAGFYTRTGRFGKSPFGVGCRYLFYSRMAAVLPGAKEPGFTAFAAAAWDQPGVPLHHFSVFSAVFHDHRKKCPGCGFVIWIFDYFFCAYGMRPILDRQPVSMGLPSDGMFFFHP